MTTKTKSKEIKIKFAATAFRNKLQNILRNTVAGKKIRSTSMFANLFLEDYANLINYCKLIEKKQYVKAQSLQYDMGVVGKCFVADERDADPREAIPKILFNYLESY
jgi:hypothetical protein